MYSCIDLNLIYSAPQTTPSVNAGINSNDFLTEWGTFSKTAALILSLPAGCTATTFDVSAAYRITPVHPNQQHALCVMWRDQVYLDLAAPFGLRSSACVFGSIANMLMAIYNAAGFGPICKWVDNFFVIQQPGETWTKQEFMDLTARLGVPWLVSKLRVLASIQRYIGLDWNLVTHTVAMPPKKLQATLKLAALWLVGNRKSKADTACLHGKLVNHSCAQFHNLQRASSHHVPPSPHQPLSAWTSNRLPRWYTCCHQYCLSRCQIQLASDGGAKPAPPLELEL
jgi:hypothetical protein